MDPEQSSSKGIRIKVWHIPAFMTALISVMLLIKDGVSDAGVGWWTLFEIVVASAIAGGAVLWLIARARRKLANRGGGAPPN